MILSSLFIVSTAFLQISFLSVVSTMEADGGGGGVGGNLVGGWRGWGLGMGVRVGE